MKKLVTLLLAIALLATVALPALAVDFMPSVVAKPAPELIPLPGDDGGEYAAIIRDEEGNMVVGVPFGDLIITPYSQAESAAPEIRDMLLSSYAQLKAANSLSELSGDLEDVIHELYEDISVDDLVVRDLFDISLTGTYQEYLDVEGNTIWICFDLLANSDELIAVLHNIEGTTWETLPNNHVIRNDDQTVTLVYDCLSPSAFLFDAGQLPPVGPEDPTSPPTGEDDSEFVTMDWFMVGGVVVVAAAAAACVVIKKRSSKKA